MNIEAIGSIIGLLGIGGVIGAYFNHEFEKQKTIELHLRERKEDQYKKFLENLIGFFEGWLNPERKKNAKYQNMPTVAILPRKRKRILKRGNLTRAC